MQVIIITISIAIVAIILGAVGGYAARKRTAEAQIGSAEEEARRIIAEAQEKSSAEKKESILEAKEEIHRMRQELDRDTKEKRSELARQEKRVIQKEENLDKKIDSLEKKELLLSKKEAKLNESQAELDSMQARENAELERVAAMSKEEARSILMAEVEENLKHDKAIKIKEYEAQIKDEADKKAREILSTAIQRTAAEHVAETTVSVVSLPSDDMKGRIIGREGRNIRALETLTGVDLIIDDTPEAVILSGFDPIRREIARVTLEKLIADGRIHPARIEETFKKAKVEVDEQIKVIGEQAVAQVGLQGSVHPELMKLLGTLKYRSSYGQNVLNHSIEVAQLAGIMASELGVDVKLAKRAGLLHDIGKAPGQNTEGSHVTIGVDYAKHCRENKYVINAIAAHHGDTEPLTVEAVLVAAADAVSAARPGARRESIEIYLKRLKVLEEIAESFEGVEQCFAIQAGREIRVMVKPDRIDDLSAVTLAHDIVKRIEKELDYPGQIKATIIRETRVVDYAK